jgi:hypothetical protein
VGVALEPGSHIVDFRFEPGPTKPILALAGGAVLAAGLVLGRRRLA